MYAILSKGVAMKSVMELLYELRVDHDLTQAEVGAVLGISQQHYSNMKRVNMSFHSAILFHWQIIIRFPPTI